MNRAGNASSYRIAIVNRFAPPDGAPTATAAAELAHDLAAALPHAVITLYASNASYNTAASCAPNLPTRRTRSIYAGKWPPARLAASLLEGWTLARRAAREADLVISLSDPPLLSLWTDRACRAHGRRWIEWTLDRYPDFFAAAGLIGHHHPLLRFLAGWDARVRHDAVIALGAGQLSHLAGKRGPLPTSIVLPVGLIPPPALTPNRGPPPDPTLPLTLIYAGNLGEAHNPSALTAILNRADPARFRFRLAVRGRHAAGLHRQLANHPAVSWQEHLSTDDLSAAAAHLVSLSVRATHLSVPSKAVTAVCLGRPFLFIGAAEADTWRDLGCAGWLIPEHPDGTLPPAAIDAALMGLADPAQHDARTTAARALAMKLHETRSAAIATIAAIIRSFQRQDNADSAAV